MEKIEEKNCSVCHRKVYETVHTLTTYTVDYYEFRKEVDKKVIVSVVCADCLLAVKNKR